MKVELKSVNRRNWLYMPIIFFSISILGCKVYKKNWVNEMLAEMEQAWIAENDSGGNQSARDKAVTAVAEKYFSPEMSGIATTELLKELEDEGFYIGERRRDGHVKWPERSLIPYASPEEEKAAIKYIPNDSSEIIIRNDHYGTERLLIKKGVAISLIIHDRDGVTKAEAKIWTSTI